MIDDIKSQIYFNLHQWHLSGCEMSEMRCPRYKIQDFIYRFLGRKEEKETIETKFATKLMNKNLNTKSI